MAGNFVALLILHLWLLPAVDYGENCTAHDIPQQLRMALAVLVNNYYSARLVCCTKVKCTEAKQHRGSGNEQCCKV